MTKKELETKTVETLDILYEECFPKDESDFIMILDSKISALEKNGDKKNIVKIQFEKILIGLYTENTTNNRFPSLKNEAIKASCTKENIDYIKEKIQNTSNNILKAKFSDIIVEINKGEIDYAKIAIDSYTELGKVYLQNNTFDYEFSDVISRALSLALLYKDKERISIAYKQHLDSLKILLEEKRYVSFKKVLQSIITREKSLKPDFESFEIMIEEAIKNDKGKSQTAYRLNQSLLELLITLPPNKKNKVKFQTIKKRIAKSIEEEGDFVGKTRSKMVAGIIYQKALHIHTSISSSKNIVETLMKKIRATNKEAVEKEYKKVPFTFSAPQNIIKKEFKKYAPLDTINIIKKLSLDYTIIPNYTKTLEALNTNFRSPIFVQKSMKNGLNIKSSLTHEEKLNAEIIKLIGIQTDFLSQTILNDIFELLKSKNSDWAVVLEYFLKSSGVVANERINLIIHGLYLYAKNDFISSMHILVFQIEGILRDILHNSRGATFQYKNSESREHTLGAIIRKLEESQILNINLLKHIEIFLCEIQGKNIRNDIAHGNSNFNHFTKNNVQVLIQMLLMLSQNKNDA